LDLTFGRVLLLCRGWLSLEAYLHDYLCRFLLRHPSYASLRSLLPNPSTPCPPNRETVVYDIGTGIEQNHLTDTSLTLSCLGAGCGLTSLVLSLCGYSVIATDKLEILPLLQKNTEFHSSSTSSRNISVRSFDWKDSNSNEIVANVFDRSPDLVLLSDCFYRSDSVAQLCKLIAKVSISLALDLTNLIVMTMADFHTENYARHRK
jgi:hypothetical protein